MRIGRNVRMRSRRGEIKSRALTIQICIYIFLIGAAAAVSAFSQFRRSFVRLCLLGATLFQEGHHLERITTTQPSAPLVLGALFQYQIGKKKSQSQTQSTTTKE